jgi:hypothetical protein
MNARGTRAITVITLLLLDNCLPLEQTRQTSLHIPTTLNAAHTLVDSEPVPVPILGALLVIHNVFEQLGKAVVALDELEPDVSSVRTSSCRAQLSFMCVSVLSIPFKQLLYFILYLLVADFHTGRQNVHSSRRPAVCGSPQQGCGMQCQVSFCQIAVSLKILILDGVQRAGSSFRCAVHCSCAPQKIASSLTAHWR